MSAYDDFIRAKIVAAPSTGFDIDESEINPILKGHQRAIVRWNVQGGRRANFAAFGLGKTVIQLETVRIVRSRAGGMALIVIPLGVRQEFMRDAAMLGVEVKFIRRIEEASNPEGIYLTNYETVRDGKLDPRRFSVASLDEASVLRGFGGTKTFREFMAIFAGDDKRSGDRVRSDGVRYRFVATATPSPNEYIELLAYAAFLGVMDVGQAKTRFFKRDSVKADKLTIHPHKVKEFWLWVSTWALFVQKPSDIGFSDSGYTLPDLQVIYHEVQVDHGTAAPDKHGRGQLFREAIHGVIDASREKRETLPARIDAMKAILAKAPDDRFLIWHDLEAERHAIDAAVPGVVSVYGSQDLEDREKAIIDFSNGAFQYLAAKPVIAGSGCNFQRHCHKAIFLGIGFKFNDFIQAVHRIQRFLQERPVEIHVIYAESERSVLRALQTKWTQHKELVGHMTEIIREHGLGNSDLMAALRRGIGVERVEVKGRDFTCVHDDCVKETARMPANSVDLILTSIPFSTQYEYSPNYNDFGHTDDNAHFFRQMDFLTPELMRVLKPGRIAAIHVKDRIMPMGLSKMGFQTVYRLHCKAADHFEKHGFGYLGMKTIVTDVVRENNQTYRLGYTEQCKDGTKMGVGMPEYLLLFRKPASSTENSYADEPVVKTKRQWIKPKGEDEPGHWSNDDGYSMPRWQVDAHGFARSSGDRLLTPQELIGVTHDVIFKKYREHSLSTVYDFKHHVRIGEALHEDGRLPSTFMLLQPQSWHPDVWTDITRMLTLNGEQSAKGREMHLCPMQFDLADRVIEQFSMKGGTVFDPFGGLMTVPYRALKLGRKGYGVELNPQYFLDGVAYCKAAERDLSMPSLFDFEEMEAA